MHSSRSKVLLKNFLLSHQFDALKMKKNEGAFLKTLKCCYVWKESHSPHVASGEWVGQRWFKTCMLLTER